MSCGSCKRDIKIVARGLCRACYQRWNKRGTTDYAPPRVRTFCQIDDCGKPVVSNGLCNMHRQRLLKHGDAYHDGGRGGKTKHPLYHSWAWMMRHKATYPVDERWNDFLCFCLDVGERPEPKAKLFAADNTKPIGPGNFVWKCSITQMAKGEDRKTYLARIQKVYRSVRKEAFQEYDLKRHYGLSKKQYDGLAESQSHKCAICQRPEGSVIKGKPIRLAVDHCHTTGAIRGLLCSPCNRALGGFGDSEKTLRRAILYLKSKPVL